MKYLLTIPVLAVALLLHSCTEKDSTDETAVTETKKITKYDQNTPEGVFEVVDQMPEFKGGNDVLMTFMGENTVYPESAKKADESGTVYVKFIINEAGEVTKPEVLLDISAKSVALHRAAISTISKMPAWNPGEQDGKKVKVQYVMPIKFALS